MKKIEIKIKELILEIENMANQLDVIGATYKPNYEINGYGELEFFITTTEFLDLTYESDEIPEDLLLNYESIIPDDYNPLESIDIDEDYIDFGLGSNEKYQTIDRDNLQPHYTTTSLKELDIHWYNFVISTTDILYDNFLRLNKLAHSLITLLDENLQKKYKDNLLKINIEHIKKKKYITVKEFSEIYNMSSETQKRKRARIHDYLPSIQISEGCKIMYNVEEVDIWLENERIKEVNKNIKKIQNEKEI